MQCVKMNSFHQLLWVGKVVREEHWVLALNSSSALKDVSFVLLEVQPQLLLLEITVFLCFLYPVIMLLAQLLCIQWSTYLVLGSWLREVCTNREIHAQILMAFRRPNLSRMLSKLSFHRKTAPEKRSFVVIVLVSALLSLVSWVTMSGGHWLGSESHCGPRNQRSVSITSLPRLPIPAGLSLVPTCLHITSGCMGRDLANSVGNKLLVFTVAANPVKCYATVEPAILCDQREPLQRVMYVVNQVYSHVARDELKARDCKVLLS